jgi:putative transposase
VVIEMDTSLPGLRVISTLGQAITCYGKPNRLVLDNGREFSSHAFLAWVQRLGIEPSWLDPGRPIQNACAEIFKSRSRDECLDQHVFTTVPDARAPLDGWRIDYKSLRPHTSLGGLAPDDWRASQTGGVRLV